MEILRTKKRKREIDPELTSLSIQELHKYEKVVIICRPVIRFISHHL